MATANSGIAAVAAHPLKDGLQVFTKDKEGNIQEWKPAESSTHTGNPKWMHSSGFVSSFESWSGNPLALKDCSPKSNLASVLAGSIPSLFYQDRQNVLAVSTGGKWATTKLKELRDLATGTNVAVVSIESEAAAVVCYQGNSGTIFCQKMIYTKERHTWKLAGGCVQVGDAAKGTGIAAVSDKEDELRVFFQDGDLQLREYSVSTREELAVSLLPPVTLKLSGEVVQSISAVVFWDTMSVYFSYNGRVFECSQPKGTTQWGRPDEVGLEPSVARGVRIQAITLSAQPRPIIVWLGDKHEKPGVSVKKEVEPSQKIAPRDTNIPKETNEAHHGNGDAKTLKVKHVKIFYTRKQITSIHLTYNDQSSKSVKFEKDAAEDTDDKNQTELSEEIKLAEDEEIISLWGDSALREDSRIIRQILVCTSYGRMTRLCGMTSTSSETPQCLQAYSANMALLGFSDTNLPEWSARTPCLQVERIMATLEASISQYEWASESNVVIETGSGGDAYKELINAIKPALKSFAGDVWTLKGLVASETQGPLKNAGSRTQTISDYVFKCREQLKDIPRRLSGLIRFIEDTRTGSKRISISEDLVAMSHSRILTQHIKQWEKYIIDCKTKLIEGLQKRRKTAERCCSATEDVCTSFNEELCSCTKLMIQYDDEAIERSKTTLKRAESLLEDVEKQRASLEDDFRVLRSRANAWELELDGSKQTGTAVVSESRTSDLLASWPSTEVDEIDKPELFWQKFKEIWEVVAKVEEVREYLRMDSEMVEIFKRLQITIEWDMTVDVVRVTSDV